jgi:hypothetical protein
MPTSTMAMIAIQSAIRDFERPELVTMSSPPAADYPSRAAAFADRTPADGKGGAAAHNNHRP